MKRIPRLSVRGVRTQREKSKMEECHGLGIMGAIRSDRCILDRIPPFKATALLLGHYHVWAAPAPSLTRWLKKATRWFDIASRACL